MASPPQPQRGSNSKSPSAPSDHFLTPAPPSSSPRGDKSRPATVTTTTSTSTTTSTTTTSTSSDVGVIRLPGQVSQNDDRLPQQPPHLQRHPSGSESGGSAPQVLTLTQVPVLDDSPANYPVGHPYTQGSSSSAPSTQGELRHGGYPDYHYDAASQSTDVLSIPGTLGPDIALDAADASYSSQSNHSENSSYYAHNSSAESGSHGTNHSSMHSRSSESQTSEMSFTNAETSTPRQTPIRQVESQKSTPSDSDQHFSASSQLSPIARITSKQKHVALVKVQSIQKGSTVDSHSQQEGFGADPSVDEVEEAFAEEVDPNATQDIFESDSNFEESDLSKEGATDAPGQVRSTSPQTNVHTGADRKGKAILGQVRSASPPTNVLTGADRKGKAVANMSADISERDYEYLDSDEDEASRSTLSNKLDLNMSQSQANILGSLSVHSRVASGSGTTSSTFIASGQKEKTPPRGGAAATSNQEDGPAEPAAGPGDKHLVDTVFETKDPTSDKQAATNSSAVRQTMVMPSQVTGTPPSPPRRIRSHRSPRQGASTPLELPSSQMSASPHTSSDSFLSRLRSAASQEGPEEEEEPKFTAVPKRPRTIKEIAQPVAPPEDADFWSGSGMTLTSATHQKRATVRDTREHERFERETLEEETGAQETRSRSGSQDISSFPSMEQEMEDMLPGGSELGEESEGDDGPSSPTASANTEDSSSPRKLSLRPRTRQTRDLRKKNSSQVSVSTSPARRTLRRHQSVTEAFRAYKADDPVWARWRKCYYAGRAVRKDGDHYEIHFLDDDIASCESSQMRPLKLKLGADVLAKKTEQTDHAAIVEGFQIAAELELSRVDVRFEDGQESNVSLNDVSLTPEMMVKLDTVMDWDDDVIRPSQEPLATIAEPSASFSQQSSSMSAPSTPRKAKNRKAALDRQASELLTPSRRGRTEASSLAGPSTPSRRGKDLFKDLAFVVTLSAPGGSRDFEREVTAKIRNGGGAILDRFDVDAPRGSQTNVLLISFSAVRTRKYIEALGLNITRLSYRWIESCCDARRLLPYQSYMLPSGISKELDTMVSSTPSDDRGVFEGLVIGLCTSSIAYRDLWDRALRAGGATVILLTPRSGPKNCNYIVFHTERLYKLYCEANPNVAVPPLADEWVVQCLINQRIMAVKGHPSYTEMDKKITKEASAGQK